VVTRKLVGDPRRASSRFAQAHPDVLFPAELKSMMAPDWNCEPEWYVQDNYLEPPYSYRLHCYRDTPEKPKPRAAFQLVGRPYCYGLSGVRHYYVDESGVIRGTPPNRDATRDDLPIPECEWAEHKACSSN
jgi:hypothetical protein